MELHIIHSGLFKVDGGAMFGVVPKSVWNRLLPADADNLTDWAMRNMLIVQGDRKILIDVGLGDKQEKIIYKHFGLHGDYSTEKSLRQAGYSPEDITDVFLTHMHLDHVGGAVKYADDGKTLVPAFPNAVYWSNEAHWESAMRPNPREKAAFLKENFIPLMESQCVEFVRPASRSPFKKIDILFCDGHTEKQMLPVIRYNGKNILFAADLVPSAHHLRAPYVMAYDLRPLLTMNEKEEILSNFCGPDDYVFFQHDIENELCQIEKSDKGFKVNTFLKLKDIVN